MSLRGVVAVLACLAALLVVMQAEAQETQGRQSDEPGLEPGTLPEPVPYVEGEERHCVAALEADSEEEASAGVTTPRVSCYEEFDDAIEVATDGRVTDVPNDASLAAEDPEVRVEIFAPAEQESPTQREQTKQAPERTAQESEPYFAGVPTNGARVPSRGARLGPSARDRDQAGGGRRRERYRRLLYGPRHSVRTR